ncbi:MAG TPA: hypothetical protein VIV40_26235, partial [Kofleriaceae bacterium]
MRLLLVLACAACATPAGSEPRRNQASPPSPEAKPAPDSRYTEHVAELRTRLGKRGLRKLEIRVEDPFVVVGNGSPDDLAHDASTVRWAVEHLEADFFAARPTKILDVYLFRDAESYERGVKTLTGEA